jgi:GntR family transcriptional repressor for pyruvate dehydrogenase complex
VLNREDALEEDLLFHLAIASASGNSTMNALMLQITPKIISVFEMNRVCDDDEVISGLNMHQAIFDAIKEKNVAKATESMAAHFGMLTEFCNNLEDSDGGLNS